MKTITFILAFLAISLFQGCDALVDSLIKSITEEDELEIRGNGQECVSDFNTYILDSGSYSVHVSFTGLSTAEGTHYRPKVIISCGGGELDSFSGDNEINGEHSETYSAFSTEVEVYAELRQAHNPLYYDTCRIKLTNISVY